MAWYEKELVESLLKKSASERITAEEALSKMYFSINFKNEERTPKIKTPMIKSPSLDRKHFE